MKDSSQKKEGTFHLKLRCNPEYTRYCEESGELTMEIPGHGFGAADKVADILKDARMSEGGISNVFAAIEKEFIVEHLRDLIEP